jgi:hypothetical protein
MTAALTSAPAAGADLRPVPSAIRPAAPPSHFVAPLPPANRQAPRLRAPGTPLRRHPPSAIPPSPHSVSPDIPGGQRAPSRVAARCTLRGLPAPADRRPAAPPLPVSGGVQGAHAPATHVRPQPLSEIVPPPNSLSPNIPGGRRAPGAAGGQRPPIPGPRQGAAQ